MKNLLLYINMVVMAKMQNLYYGKKYNFNIYKYIIVSVY